MRVYKLQARGGAEIRPAEAMPEAGRQPDKPQKRGVRGERKEDRIHDFAGITWWGGQRAGKTCPCKIT